MNKEFSYNLFKIAIFILLTFALFAMISNPTNADESMTLIDVKPGSCPNAVNIGRNGVLPVAIFGSESLHVDAIDRASVNLGLGEEPDMWVQPIRVKISFINEDGYPDLIMHFSMEDINPLYHSFIDARPIFESDPFIQATVKFSAEKEYEASDWLYIPKLHNNKK